jgi:hypothetical protein
MPSYRVTGASVSHSKYDVVGEDRERPQFIAHVGLAAYEAVSQANAVAIIDMGPPLHVAGELHSDGRLSADSLGLSGSGPWPVLLCGYLFHALSRSAGAIRESPYAPIAGDQFFMRETEDADEPRTP